MDVYFILVGKTYGFTLLYYTLTFFEIFQHLKSPSTSSWHARTADTTVETRLTGLCLED